MNDTNMMAMLHNRRYLVTVAHVLLLNSRHSVISVNVFFLIIVKPFLKVIFAYNYFMLLCNDYAVVCFCFLLCVRKQSECKESV